MKLIAVLAGFAFVLVAGCDSQEDDVDNNDVYATESFSYDIPVAQQSRFRLNGVNGNVHVEATAGLSTISVTGERRVGSSSVQDAEDHLDELEVIISEGTSEVSVRTEQPQNSHGRNYVVEYDITIPPSFDVVIANVNGNASVKDVGGSTRLDLTNGNISVHLETTADGDVDLATVNGNISLAIPRTTSATFSAQLVNGNINVTDLELTDIVTGNTSLTGVLGDGEFDIDLETVNGNIEAVGHD